MTRITGASACVMEPTEVLCMQALVDGRVLCVHGGLSPDLRTLDQAGPSTSVAVDVCDGDHPCCTVVLTMRASIYAERAAKAAVSCVPAMPSVLVRVY